MRKIYNLGSKVVDVLIVDEVGSDYIKESIPIGFTYSVLRKRRAVPLIYNVYFFFRLVKWVFRRGFSPIALVSAIVDVKKPKVIMTFIDNNPLMGELKREFSNIMVLSVQNALRADDVDCIGVWDKSFSFSVYFGFGEYEYQLMKEKKVNIEEYIAAGSLKLGLYLDRRYEKNIINERICYISQYRDGMKSSDDPLYSQFVDMSEEVCRYIYNFSEGASFFMGVAMVGGEEDDKIFYINELRFYTKLLGSERVEYQENNRRKLASYGYALNSGVVITMDSSLAFELFGCGKKVLFCGGANSRLMMQWGTNKIFEKMPEEVLLDVMDYGVFCKKVEKLIAMNEEEYLFLTKEARSYFMKCEEPYAHNIILDYISKNI